MSSMEPSKGLILSIISLLQQQAEHSSPDKKESIEVAVQCLESAFDIDYSRDYDIFGKIENLVTVYNRSDAGQALLLEAEGYKSIGNDYMRDGRYQKAVEEYSRAITINPNNAVYCCNRAAAYSRLENHGNAIVDCEKAVTLDPGYAEAYGRLGIAYASLNRYRDARDAYKKALLTDPGNTMYEENLKLAEERMLSNPLEGAVPANLTDVDITQFINNPNVLSMASQMLNDPGVRDAMSGILQMGHEGGNPNIDALVQMGHQLAQQMQVNNPTFVDNLRRQFSEEGTSSEEGLSSPNPASDTKKDKPPSTKRGGA